MNPRPTLSKDQLLILLFPDEITVALFRRHPIFWWHKRHIRSIMVIPELKNDVTRPYFIAQYFDARTGIRFISREAAQSFLGKAIIEPWYSDEECHEKMKVSQLCVICKTCGRISSEAKNVTFRGPFYFISNPIKIIVQLPCPTCKTIIPIEVSTVANSELQVSKDCDWLEHPISPDIKRVK